MGLNVSSDRVEGVAFPVLGDPPFTPERAMVAMAELEAAAGKKLSFDNEVKAVRVYKEGSRALEMARSGVYFNHDGIANDVETVHRTTVIATVWGWRFRRAWYYWVCDANVVRAIPREDAVKLNARLGGQVRVDGYSGGNDVTGPVDLYHVDTVEGLKALLDLIKK